ncbi:7-carboxy-7-deazaguanine synthase QueE [Prevotella sp.]|uniref:7-carboxy-7-deazaguanine synthase QueE n=1 Tax=Prevotella sp. TaxID=59823 RepID=UPI003FD7A4A6
MMRVNEIFYSLQGEGHFAGTPAVFIRFSGCNLKCSFCDTDHSSFSEMTEEEIVAEAKRFPAKHIVITGGEPGLQITTLLVRRLHEEGCFVQMETNGTRALPEGCCVDWITCSPKYERVILPHVDELKVVYEGDDTKIDEYAGMTDAKILSLQPCDVKDEVKNRQNLKGAINYCLRNPEWHLSLQTHKIIDVR